MLSTYRYVLLKLFHVLLKLVFAETTCLAGVRIVDVIEQNYLLDSRIHNGTSSLRTLLI
jgi:hypothetical protein